MTRQTLLKVIAVQEMVGGLLGLVLTFGRVVNGGLVQGQLPVAFVPLVLFLLALVAGVLLWRGHPVGHSASVAVQLAQLVKIATPQLAFAMCYGGDVAVLWSEQTHAAGHTLRTAGINSHAGSIAVVEYGRPPGATQWFGVSIVSVVALAVLRKNRQPASASDERPETAHAPVAAAGEPDWVLPARLKVAVVLFAIFVASCAGLFTVWR